MFTEGRGVIEVRVDVVFEVLGSPSVTGLPVTQASASSSPVCSWLYVSAIHDISRSPVP